MRKFKLGILLCLSCIMLAACLPEKAEANLDDAEATLVDYFQYLADGDYERADKLYGGSYESLQEMNPTVFPNDHISLWKNGCTINGYQCLPIRRVVSRIRVSDEKFNFVVEFRGRNGKILTKVPCCGESTQEAQPISRFKYHVIYKDNHYLVQEEPIYIP